ncbi:MAG: CHAT domain-containing protein [Cyanobacteria bacterium P01_F01_bin.86]
MKSELGCTCGILNHGLSLAGSIVLATASIVPVQAFNLESTILSPQTGLAQQVVSEDSLFTKAQRAYQAGQYEQARIAWEAAYVEFEQSGDRLNQISVLNALCATYQQLGNWNQAQRIMEQSLELISSIDQDNSQSILLKAQALNTQGTLQLAMGKPESAYNVWQQAEQFYQQVKDQEGELGSRINQVQALQAMGLYRQAYLQLIEMQEQVDKLPDSSLKVTGLKSLGDVFQVTGNLKEAQHVLQESIALAEQIEDQVALSSVWLSLGNAYRGSEMYDAAMQAYRTAAQTSTHNSSEANALLSELSLLIKADQWEIVQQRLTILKPLVTELAPSRMGIYAQVNLAVSLQTVLENQSDFAESGRSTSSSEAIARLLSNAIRQAQSIDDQRAEAYALGQLGTLYEQTQQFDFALNLTNRALTLSETVNARESTYRWQWQKGRILKTQSDQVIGQQKDELEQKAIAAYGEAVDTLKLIRADLIAADSLIQFSFRDAVEPVYREFVDLLAAPNATETHLQMARQAIEDLQLAELQNFFRSACLDIQVQQIDQVDPTAAVIYPVILPDRLLVITSLPEQPLQQHSVSLTDIVLHQTVDEFLQTLNPVFSDKARLEVSKTIYQWLISPLKETFNEQQIETLVFVLDGPLRNIPIAALHSGDRYLIEDFNIALTPGLQLLSPQSLSENELNVLAGAVTEAHQGFPALPGVATEIEAIASILPTTIFLNEDFTTENLKNQVNRTSFPVVHLATHGQFSSNLDDTFLLGWEQPLQIQDFQVLVRERLPQINQPIELLVLSACQTAEGDDRAALGLAGFAVRSGARSTLATLWSVDDQSTALLISNFYNQIVQQENISKATALRKAQISLLQSSEYAHPFYWSPFVLVGNWL